MNTSQLSLSGVMDSLRVMIIGHQGTGKTYQMRHWPRDCWVADFDKKISCLRGEDIDYDIFVPGHPATEELLESYGIKTKDCRAVMLAFGKRLSEKVADNKTRTICIDTCTSMGLVLMGCIREENGHFPPTHLDNPYEGRFRVPSKGDKGKTGAPTLPEYGIFYQKMQEILMQWRRIHKCFVFNCHIRYRTRDDGTILRAQPATQGDLIAGAIADAFEEIWVAKRSGFGNKINYTFTTYDPYLSARTAIGLPREFPQDYREIKRLVEEKGGDGK